MIDGSEIQIILKTCLFQFSFWVYSEQLLIASPMCIAPFLLSSSIFIKTSVWFWGNWFHLPLRFGQSAHSIPLATMIILDWACGPSKCNLGKLSLVWYVVVMWLIQEATISGDSEAYERVHAMWMYHWSEGGKRTRTFPSGLL